MNKPPLGVVPQFLWNEQRMVDLTDAIERYFDAGKVPPTEWLIELIDVTAKVARHIAQRENKTTAQVIQEANELMDLLQKAGSQ